LSGICVFIWSTLAQNVSFITSFRFNSVVDRLTYMVSPLSTLLKLCDDLKGDACIQSFGR